MRSLMITQLSYRYQGREGNTCAVSEFLRLSLASGLLPIVHGNNLGLYLRPGYILGSFPINRPVFPLRVFLLARQKGSVWLCESGKGRGGGK